MSQLELQLQRLNSRLHNIEKLVEGRSDHSTRKLLEAIMADLSGLKSAVAAMKVTVDAAVAALGSATPQADVDALTADVTAMNTELANGVTPPAPPAEPAA